MMPPLESRINNRFQDRYQQNFSMVQSIGNKREDPPALTPADPLQHSRDGRTRCRQTSRRRDSLPWSSVQSIQAAVSRGDAAMPSPARRR